MPNTVRIDRTKCEAEVRAMSQEAVMRGARKYRERVRREIIQSGRVRTGEMAEKIEIRPLPPVAGVARAVVDPRSFHFAYQDKGTRGSVARPGGALRFMPKGATAFIFRKRVRGVSAAHFLLKARMRMRPEDFV